jgi:hypothetical protein
MTCPVPFLILTVVVSAIHGSSAGAPPYLNHLCSDIDGSEILLWHP